MSSPVVFAVTRAQAEVLVQDRRKRQSKYNRYRVCSGLARKGLLRERRDRWELTVSGLALAEFLRFYLDHHQA